MKKVIAILIIICIATACLMGCADNDDGSTTSNDKTSQPSDPTQYIVNVDPDQSQNEEIE